MGRDTILESVQQQMDDQLQYIDVDNLIVRIPYGANAELKTFIARCLVSSKDR
jgi:hypothetical protein